MKEALEFIKQTIEINNDILSGNEEDTNEMLVVDLLEALGYNRKRSRNLVKLRGQEADWKLITKDGYIIIRVIGLGGDLLGEQAENMKPSDIIGSGECDGDDFIGLISTDGNRIVMHTQRFPNKAIIDLKITSIDEKGLAVLESIKSDMPVKEYINELEDFADASLVKELIANKNPDLLNDNIVDTFGADRVFDIIKDYYTENITLAEGEQKPTEVVIKEVDKAIPDGMELVSSEELAIIKTRALEADQLEKELDSIKSSSEVSNNSEILSLKNLVASLNSKVAEKEAILSSYEKRDILNKNEIDQYKKDIAELRKLIEHNENVDANSYIAQIEELHVKISELEDELATKAAELESIKNTDEVDEDPMVATSKEILDTIDDNQEEPYSYVGVVNGNMYQCKTIEKFIGTSLQELYAIVTFELMPYLFDGDIFTITDKAVRKDMLIGNRVYDILVDDIPDDDCINRLKTLFRKFPAVTFLVKTIGNKNIVEEEDTEASDTDENSFFKNDEGFEHVEPDTNEDEDDFQGEIDETVVQKDDELIDDFGVDFGDSNVPVDDQITDDFERESQVEPEETFENVSEEELGIVDTGYRVNGTVCFAICDLSNVLWNNMIEIREPKYIYYPEKTFIINGFTLEEQFSDLIHALLCYTDNAFLSAKKLSEIDFSTVSNLINIEGEGIKIPFTKYSINTDNFNKTLPIINFICENIGVSTENAYIYFSGSILSQEFEGNVVDTSTFEFPNVDMAKLKKENSTDQHCIIPGNVLVNFNLDETFYEVLRNLVKRCVAVKTNYMQVPFKSHEDLEYAITEILVNYDGDLDELSDVIGNCPGDDFSIISRNIEDVSDNHFMIQLNGDDYYVSEVEPWQQVCMLLMMHRKVVGDNTISLRVVLDKELFNKYVNELTESNPDKAFAIKSLIDYMSDRLK